MISINYSLFLLALIASWNSLIQSQKVPWARTLYPYGKGYGDLETTLDRNGGSPKFKLPFNVTFMGHRFNYTWIGNSGIMGFQKEIKMFKTHTWPAPKYPAQDDPIFLTAFYMPIDLANDREYPGASNDPIAINEDKGRVLYRNISRMDLFKGYDEESRVRYNYSITFLNMVQSHIRKSVASAEEFVASHAVIATYGNITFDGIDSDLPFNQRPRNTFQIVLATDSNMTFAIFNYEKIVWDSAPTFGANFRTGTKGKKEALIGFNRGNGTLWVPMEPWSRSRFTKSVAEGSNVNFPGRYIFRVDEWIQPGGCMEGATSGELHMWPLFGNMLGGSEVNITGPCFNQVRKLLCKWGDDRNAPVTAGEVRSSLRARCVSPTLFFQGRLNLSISMDEGRTYTWNAIYTIVDALKYPSKIQLGDIDEWHSKGTIAERLPIRWNRYDLSWSESHKVDIHLWGYYEGKVGPVLQPVQLIADNTWNDGIYQIPVRYNRAKILWIAKRFKMGAISVSLKSGGTEIPRRIWSPLMPLGWWRNEEMEIYFDKQSRVLGNARGKHWGEDQCRWWHEYERFDRVWMDELPRCPCTMAFAIGDAGRWMSDSECNLDRGPYDTSNCKYHRSSTSNANTNDFEAVHCVISTKNTVEAAGSKCCYNSKGNLLYTNDTYYGSNSARVHPNGMSPYNRNRAVPSLSHYLHDKMHYFECCVWSDMCESYLYLRETRDCRGYLHPRVAGVYGDPHFVTFDNLRYMFNGKGEFYLMRSTRDKFNLQGRFEQPPNTTTHLYSSGGQVNVTRITAIAMEELGSDRIEVRARIWPSQTWQFTCDLYVNGEQQWLNSTEEKVQFFRNVTITSPVTDLYFSNMTIIMNNSQVGVNVACKNGLIHLLVSAPPTLFKETTGLLGHWSNLTDDDLTTPDGGHFQITSNTKEIHKYFGMLWRVEMATDSIFYYSGSLRFDAFHDMKPDTISWKKFWPWFKLSDVPFPSNISFTSGDVDAVCGSIEPCKYDATAMGSLEIGAATREAYIYYGNLKLAMKPTNSCGIMMIRGAIRQTNSYLAGQTMRVSCKRGYTLLGWPQYYCNWNASWLPTNNQWLAKFRDWPRCEHYHVTAIKWTGISVGILYVIAAICAGAFTIYKGRQETDYELDEDELDDLDKREYTIDNDYPPDGKLGGEMMSDPDPMRMMISEGNIPNSEFTAITGRTGEENVV
ncbi:hypothetical protein SNEBB_001005 [Seison nebaliae]|nr:hypothetical protein SNEBB_001005 [Seison nebaliae]